MAYLSIFQRLAFVAASALALPGLAQAQAPAPAAAIPAQPAATPAAAGS